MAAQGPRVIVKGQRLLNQQKTRICAGHDHIYPERAQSINKDLYSIMFIIIYTHFPT